MDKKNAIVQPFSPVKIKEANSKIEKLEKIFEKMLDVLYDGRVNWDQNENLIDTPRRIAKMYVTELFSSTTKFKEEPTMTVFKDSGTNSMVTLFDIELKSTCSHHFVPFVGKCHIGYIPKDGIVCGVSKLARIVDYFMSMPQIQEDLTENIANYIAKVLDPAGIIVVCEAQHYCMIMRGVKQFQSKMITSAVRGLFESNDEECKSEFYSLLARTAK